MKFTVVNIGTVGNATGATLTLSATVPTGATIFVCVTEKSTSGTDGSLADTLNTYVKLTSGSLAATAADGRGMLFAVTNCKALSATTITYTRNLSGSAAAMSAFYVEGATGATTFTEGLVTATGTTGTITVTSGSLGAGRLVLGALFDSGSTTAGGNATFTQAGSFVTPPVEIKSAAGSAQARVNGGTLFKSATGTQVYNPTLSSTAQQWFLAVLGIIPAPDSASTFDRPALPRPLPPWPVDQQNLLLTTLAVPPTPPDTTHILRAPVFARLPDPRPKAYQEYPPNLPVSTLAPQPPATTAVFRSPLFVQIYPTIKAQQEYVVNLLPVHTPPVVTFTISLLDQFNWPNPTRAPAKAVGEATAAPAPLYTPNPAQPFVQSDWPRAWDGKARAVGEPIGGISPLLTPNPATPFNQYEWRSTARVPLSLKSDVYFGAFALYSPNPSIPFNQDLWENAARAYPKAVGEPVAGVAPLLTPNPAQSFAQSDWPRPLDPKAKAVGEPQAGISALLTPNPAQPFVQSDWFQIRFTQKAKVDDPYNATIIQPAVVVARPFYYYDDGVRSVPAARAPAKAVGEAVPGISPLLTPNPSRPFNQNLWDSATRGYPKAIGEVTGTLSPVLTPNPARPFNQSDWLRQPALPKAVGEPLAAISALYNPNPSKPFSQYQWDLATRAWPKAVGEALGEINVLFTPNPAQPFVQYDWPAIRFTQKARVDDPYNVTITLPVTVRYIHQDDWPLTARPPLPQKSDVYGAIRPLYSPNPTRPFIQTDWRRPTEPIKLKAVGEPIGRVAPLLTPNPARPFRQADWPSSTPRTPLAKTDDFLNLFPLHAPPVVTRPFVQTDWPLATAGRRSDQQFALGRDINNLLPQLGFGRRKPLLIQAMGVISGGGGGGTQANFWPDGSQELAQQEPPNYVTEDGAIFYVDEGGVFYVAE